MKHGEEILNRAALQSLILHHNSPPPVPKYCPQADQVSYGIPPPAPAMVLVPVKQLEVLCRQDPRSLLYLAKYMPQLQFGAMHFSITSLWRKVTVRSWNPPFLLTLERIRLFIQNKNKKTQPPLYKYYRQVSFLLQKSIKIIFIYESKFFFLHCTSL